MVISLRTTTYKASQALCLGNWNLFFNLPRQSAQDGCCYNYNERVRAYARKNLQNLAVLLVAIRDCTLRQFPCAINVVHRGAVCAPSSFVHIFSKLSISRVTYINFVIHCEIFQIHLFSRVSPRSCNNVY